jgi:hypothetical protein
MRGRLINKMSATFALLDAASTVYDEDFMAPDPLGLGRQETLVTLPCQVEEASWFRSQFKPQGVEQSGEITLILHYADMELLGQIDGNGAPYINVNTRLVSIARATGVVVRTYPNPPGMYVFEARDSSWGLSIDNDPTRNLWFLLLAPRPRSL